MLILSAIASCYGLLALLMLTAEGVGGSTVTRPVVFWVTLGLIGWITLVIVLEKTLFQPRESIRPSTVELLYSGIEKISGFTGQAFFPVMLRNLEEMLGMDYTFVGELSDNGERIQTLAVCSGGEIVGNFTYALKGTPCENVVGKRLCSHTHGVLRSFPGDALLAGMGIESYIGVPLFHSAGAPLGIVVALGKKPLANIKRAELICQVFSGRTAAELERMRSEKELSAEKEFSDAVFTYAASGIMVLDSRGYVLKINRIGCSILQIKETDIVGKRITDIFPESKDMLEVNSEPSREFTIVLGDGSEVPIGFSNSRLFPASPMDHGIIVSFKDLSEIKKLRAEIRKKEDLNAMGKVISGVAHEIRNPLFGISSIGQILQREITSPQHQTLIQAMLRETDRMKHLIEELLIYARPSRLDIQDIDLGIELDEIRKLLLPKTSGKELAVHVPSGFRIRADRTKIAQVLINLLENALDAAQSRVTISAEAASGGQTITISDDGTGIRPEDMERIYEPFFTTKKGGTGLGLPICKKIVEDHGGSLDIRSAPGKGTEASITLKG